MYDLLVVGAGPYGLSIASHAAAAGLNLRVLGCSASRCAWMRLHACRSSAGL
ncbi:hypothetical protein SALBM311S_12283 [Streptomyces alboniger]